MGFHAGKKWKDKPSKINYWMSGRYVHNKMKRIARCNGERAAALWMREKGRDIRNTVG